MREWPWLLIGVLSRDMAGPFRLKSTTKNIKYSPCSIYLSRVQNWLKTDTYLVALTGINDFHHNYSLIITALYCTFGVVFMDVLLCMYLF